MSAAKRIPRPRDPTVSESFETKISQDITNILVDPRGFMSEEEKLMEVASNAEGIVQKEQEQIIASTEARVAQQKPKMEPEYGFKQKGPEPTRYGDWENKGKCVDF